MTVGQIGLVAVLLLLAVAAGWMLGRRREKGGRGPLLSGRAAVRAMAQRAVRSRRVIHVRISRGLYVHLCASGAPSEEDLLRGQALMMQEAGGQPLVRFGLSDLVATDHPAAVAFYEVAGVDPDVLGPGGVVFTATPHLLRRQVTRVLGDAGLEVSESEAVAFSPSADDPFGAIQVRGRGQVRTLALAGLIGEAAATATSMEVVARDSARRLRAELTLLEAFTTEARSLFGDDAVTVEDERLAVRWGTRRPESEHVFDHHRIALGLEAGRGGWRPWLERLAAQTGAPGDGMAGAGESSEADAPAATPDGPGDAPADTPDGPGDMRDAPYPETSARPLDAGHEALLVTRRLQPLSTLERGAVGIDRGAYAEVFHIATGTGTEAITEDHPLFEDLGFDGLRDLADGLQSASRFTGWVSATPPRDGQAGAWLFVGTGAASIAQHPDLLAGASRAVGGPLPGERVRVHAAREDVLILAEVRADTPFLAGCRRRASVLLDALAHEGGAPVLIDLTVNLGTQPMGSFAFSRVDERFYAAATRCASARAADDGPAAAAARAMMRLSLGDLVGARAHLEEAERIAPEDGEILLALGTLLNELGDHRAAEPVLRRAVGLDAENPAMNNNLGVAYQGMSRLTEAQLFFEKAASLKPGDAVVRVNLGRARLDSGDAAGAEHSFRDALARDPRCVPALTGLVLVAVREGDVSLARDRLASALSVDPSDAGLLRLHRALHPEESMH